jgi:predicted esterase
MEERHLAATRTARYFTLGGGGQAVRDVWFALHGYGQLASAFLRDLEPLASPSRLLIAPEALSRFYLDPITSGPAARRRVGATWMTREDRLVEIDDYVRYLDALYARVFETVARAESRVTVFGFSQGTATACRWLTRGAARADRLVLWAGEVPPDLDLASARTRLSALELIRVAGRGDELITSKVVARDTARLEAAGIAFRVVEFDGGHTIEGEVLKRIGEGGKAKGEG